MQEAIERLRQMLEGFDNDPADSEFQRGYQAALKIVWHEVLNQAHWDRVSFKQ